VSAAVPVVRPEPSPASARLRELGADPRRGWFAAAIVAIALLSSFAGYCVATFAAR
jgi:hypothetical protein